MTTPSLIAIDTDVSLGTPRAEMDDGAALIALLKGNAEVRCIGTVHGNVQVTEATHNLRRLLSYLGREQIPVGRGSELPLVHDPSWFVPFQARYGPTPPWPDEPELPAAALLLIDTIRAHPGQVTVLALGPLTNLALAARLAPDIISAVYEVVCMGGTYGDSDAPEFNARCDPEAAHIVYSAGWPLRVLGGDITCRVHFERERFAQLPDDEPALALLKQQAPGWIDTVEEQAWAQGGCALHDAVAVAGLLDETLFKFAPATVTVELREEARRGATNVEQVAASAANARVAVEVDAGRCRDFIWSLLTARD